MITSKAIVIAILIFSLTSFADVKEENTKIKVLAAQSDSDVSHSFIVALLNLAFNNSESKYGKYVVEPIRIEDVNHESVIRLLKDSYIDVLWAGASKERENKFLSVNVPIVRGLLGYRVSIVHKDNLVDFKARGLSFFKNGIACQGQYWPDAKILSENGHNVREVAKFDHIFQLLSRKQCGYFPRAIFEAYAEVKAVESKYPELTVFDDVVIHYHLPYVFYVNKDNRALRDHITNGLTEALSNGTYDNLMKSHRLTKEIFPLSKWKSKQFLFLDNSQLPQNHRLSDNNYMMKLY